MNASTNLTAYELELLKEHALGEQIKSAEPRRGNAQTRLATRGLLQLRKGEYWITQDGKIALIVTLIKRRPLRAARQSDSK